MTDLQKQLIQDLIKGRYMRKYRNRYKLYEGNAIPVRYVNTRTACLLAKYGLTRYEQVGKSGITNIVLNRSKVLQLHGNSWIKQTYKKLRSNETN